MILFSEPGDILSTLISPVRLHWETGASSAEDADNSSKAFYFFHLEKFGWFSSVEMSPLRRTDDREQDAIEPSNAHTSRLVLQLQNTDCFCCLIF